MNRWILLPEIPLHSELNKNIEILKSAYKDCSDVIFREFSIGSSINAVLLYIDGLSNTEGDRPACAYAAYSDENHEHGCNF